MHSLANTEDEELFTQIVEKLCSLAALEEMEETIDELEKALEKSIYCKNTPFFSVVKGEIMDIDFCFQPIIDTSYLFDIRYRAEYYDGQIAPYPILFWNGPIEELLNIVKTKLPDFQIDKGEYETNEK